MQKNALVKLFLILCLPLFMGEQCGNTSTDSDNANTPGGNSTTDLITSGCRSDGNRVVVHPIRGKSPFLVFTIDSGYYRVQDIMRNHSVISDFHTGSWSETDGATYNKGGTCDSIKLSYDDDKKRIKISNYRCNLGFEVDTLFCPEKF